MRVGDRILPEVAVVPLPHVIDVADAGGRGTLIVIFEIVAEQVLRDDTV